MFGFTALTAVFKDIAPFIVTAASGIGSFVAQIGQLVSSGLGLANINIILSAGSHFMQALADAATRLLPALLTVAAQASPFLYQISNAVLRHRQRICQVGFQRWLRAVHALGTGQRPNDC